MESVPTKVADSVVRTQVTPTTARHDYDFGITDDNGRRIGCRVTCRQVENDCIEVSVQTTRDGIAHTAPPRGKVVMATHAQYERARRVALCYWRVAHKYAEPEASSC